MSKVMKLGEACRRLDVQPYVLRYWESEFTFLREGKPAKGTQRTYNGEEMQWLSRVRELLYDEGYTIVGAKRKLEAEIAGGSKPAAGSATDANPGKAPATERSVAAKKVPKPSTAKAATKKSATKKAQSAKQVTAPGAATADVPGVLAEIERDVSGLLTEARELLERLPG